MSSNKLISRRSFVAGTVGLIGSAGPMLGRAQAQIKSTQTDVAYQGTPNGAAKCGNCAFFTNASSTCRLVSGPVTADGWCTLYKQV